MAEKEPIELDYRKNDPPRRRANWRFIRVIVVLIAALVLTVMLLRRPIVGGWIGYLFPVISLIFICFLVSAEVWIYWRGEEDEVGADELDSTGGKQSGGEVRRSYPASRVLRGSVFGGVEVGCVGATILVIFTVLCAASLLAMVWWPYLHK
jgi:hypothetical protein